MSTSSAPLPGLRPARGIPSSGAPMTWVLQAFVFLIGGPPLAFPSLLLNLFLGKAPPPGEPVRLAWDAFAILWVHAFMIGILTVNALASGLPMARTRFARAFAYFTGSWGLVVLVNLVVAPQLYTWHTWALLVPAGIFFVGNLRAGLKDDELMANPSALGDTSSAPAWATPAWLGLAVVTAICGSFLFFFPATLLHWMVRDPSLVTELAVAQARFSGPYMLGYAALCIFALRTGRVEVWRALARILAVWPALVVLFSLVRFDPFTYSWTAYWLLLPFVVASIVNVVVLRAHAVPWAEDVSASLPGWDPVDFVAGPMMGVQTLSNRRRASHLFGVAARGRFLPAEGRPKDHAFFAAAEPKSVVMRFANLTEEDDASLDVRGASVSLTDRAGRFDMVMNTGSAAPVYDLWTFAMFVGSKFMPTFGSEIIATRSRFFREGAILGLRRAPPAYQRLRYHSQIVRWWFDAGWRVHLSRYRVVPEDLCDEPGLPDVADGTHVWERGRLPGESRPPNYLREGFREAIGQAPVRMRLQVQLRPGGSAQDTHWYDASVAWDESDYPWVDLGIVELTEALSVLETERLDFNPAWRPEGIGIPPSMSPWDLRSLGDSEVRVMAMLQRLRRWLDARYGPPAGGA